MRTVQSPGGSAPLPRRTTTVVSNSTSTRTVTDSDEKPNDPLPSDVFTPNDRMWFNVKDITVPPQRGRIAQRVLWTVSVCWTLAFLLVLVGLLLMGISGKLTLLFFALSTLAAVVLPIVFPWPVFTEANQHWVLLGWGGYPLRFLKQELGPGYKIHFIRPYQSVTPYRHNKPLKCNINWASTAFQANVELKITGVLEFRFDPTRAPKQIYLQLLDEKDEDLERRFAAGLSSALHQVMQDTVRVSGLSQIESQCVPALIRQIAAYFKQMEQNGYFLMPDASVIYMTLPRQVAQENLKAWAQEAKVQTSDLAMKVFFEFVGQQADASSAFKMIHSNAHLRVTVPGSRLIGEVTNQAHAVLPAQQGGLWVDPLTLTYGHIIQGFSRRSLPEADVVRPPVPSPNLSQNNDELPRRPPRYG